MKVTSTISGYPIDQSILSQIGRLGTNTFHFFQSGTFSATAAFLSINAIFINAIKNRLSFCMAGAASVLFNVLFSRITGYRAGNVTIVALAIISAFQTKSDQPPSSTYLDNYSVLNNYNYENKSDFSSKVDWLSTPCRRVLGGRNDCLLSQTYDDKMTTAFKVATVFFSVLIFPIAIISVVSFAIKLATFPFTWEKKIVIKESQKSWDMINLFNSVFQNGQYDKALQIIKERPQLGNRKDINGKLFQLINIKINNITPWVEVQSMLTLLPNHDAIVLINHAVKKQLSSEFANDLFLTSSDHIIQFVQNSLRDRSVQALADCYKKLISDAMLIDLNEDLLFNLIKMDLADHILHSLTQLKKDNAQDELERSIALLDGKLLRSDIFKKDQNYSDLYFIFNSSMQQIHAAVQEIHLIHQLKFQIMNHMSTSTPQIQLKFIHDDLIKFQHILLNNLTKDGSIGIYIDTVKSMFDNMIHFINANTPQQQEKYENEIKKYLEQQIQNLPNLLNETSISYFKIPLENGLANLKLKKIQALFDICAKLKIFLFNNKLNLE